jgi:hypothetical protein
VRLHVVCVIALLLPAASIGQQVANQSSAPSASSSAQVARHQPSASAPPIAASGAHSSSQAKKTCDQPGDETDKECKDLWAQQDMAKWARLMYIVTAIGVVVSGFVAVFVLRTFHQTRRTAAAAEDGVKHARTSAEQQLRAYVMVESISVIYPSKSQLRPPSGGGPAREHLVAFVKVKNSGATPARKVTGLVRCDRFAQAAECAIPDRPQGNGGSVIGPGHSDKFEYREKVVNAAQFTSDIAALRTGPLNLYVWGRIDYEDAFEQERVTFFRHVARRDRIDDDGAEVIACAEGNDYT